MSEKQNIEKKQKNHIVQKREKLETLLTDSRFLQSLKVVASRHLTPEKIVKMALLAASRQPKLYQCTPQSILQAIMKAAEVGLDFTGTLGRGWLVPYYNKHIKAYECQFIPGYQGLIELARRSGKVTRIEARAVYEKDTFEVSYGTHQKIKHIPYIGEDRGEIICVYAIAQIERETEPLVEVMTKAEVDSIRARSKAKDDGPWVTDYSEMARKTVVRRICKYLPLSPELERALAVDDEQYIDQANEIRQLAAGIEAVKQKLLEKPQEQEQAEEQPQEDTEMPEQEQLEPANVEGQETMFE